MNLWRLTKYASLDGEGGRLYCARWNTAGEPVVYLAASPPGALIEVLVHLELEESEMLPTYTLLRISVPDQLIIPDLSVPDGETWKTDETLTRKAGDAWIRSRESPQPSFPTPSTTCLIHSIPTPRASP